MKIQIIGYSGSGKSTLAKILANHYNLPLLYLDAVNFYGDWQERAIDEKNAIVEQFLNDNTNGWVIDGNYSNIAKRRFEESDVTIFLNYNRFYCFKMAKKRFRENKNKKRESCPCIEKFDLGFKWWILYQSRTTKRRKKHLENLNRTKNVKLIFKNRKQLERYLKENNILK